MAKVNKKLVALCVVAVGAVYGTGYAVTQPQTAQTTVQTITMNTNDDSNPNTNTNTTTISDQNTSTTTSTQSQASNKYKDGTYTGSGSNHYGFMNLSVSIKGGKIANVVITDCEMHYPQSDIDPVLPQEVLQQQSANIDFVSGATFSSMAFQDALKQALSQAQA